jgi:hypothetical protein
MNWRAKCGTCRRPTRTLALNKHIPKLICDLTIAENRITTQAVLGATPKTEMFVVSIATFLYAQQNVLFGANWHIEI